ncbi:FtsW/RodA/SpoVE family cell cycle protein [Aquimarina addita]|uniref:Probable peptidoglycan glycosyltransferase FtsW n=1 Tax=Aquimarina addita TaxID=870485 RepID=A0ABP6UMF5_9FLAO
MSTEVDEIEVKGPDVTTENRLTKHTFSFLLSKIKGDRVIWAIVALLALFSFLPVYSASSNLAYLYGDGNTFSFLIKHFAHLGLGFGIMYWIHKIPYHYFKGLSIIMLPVIVVLLLFTMAQNTTIGGANASRWIRLPFVGVTFQTSTLAALVLMTYVARYLSKIKNKEISFKETLLPLWLPVFLILILILPANFSTTAIIFSMVMMLVFLGGYPLKYIMIILSTGVLALTFFVLVAKAFPDSFSNRVDTWVNRVENFVDNKDTQEDYQIERAKIAIARGGIIGTGPGKSVQRNFLPQSSSDFIYAIIIEEWGLIGGVFLMLLYLLLLFRLVIAAHKCSDVFGKLLVVGVGLPIVFQALINMAVAVELFPVTGQTLPLVSSGGTSIWMTCMAIGMVLSVSKERELMKKEEQSLGGNIKKKRVEEENPLEILSEAL